MTRDTDPRRPSSGPATRSPHRSALAAVRAVRGRARIPGLLLAVWAAGCGRTEAEGERGGAASRHEERPVVAVSLLPLAGLVERLVPPGLVDVEVLVPPGADPHAFEPGLEPLRALDRAELVFVVGHEAFPWERRWLEGFRGTRADDVVVLSADCRVTADDPHVWLDVACLRSMGAAAARALEDRFPGAASDVERRLTSLATTLDSVELRARSRLGDAGGRAILVLHPAWSAFARAYGLEQIAILTHGGEDAGSARLARVIDRARAEGIRTVFVQPQFPPDAARVVADEIGGTVVRLDPLGRDPVAVLDATSKAIAAAHSP